MTSSPSQTSSTSSLLSAPRIALSSRIDEHDEDVMIAVQALGNMRHRAFAPVSDELTPPSYTATPSLSASTSTAPTTSIELQSQINFSTDRNPEFVSRVTELPIVHSALRAYEHGKASSRIVRFGAEVVESSVMSMAKPIYDRLPVGQLDEFACRQLDKLSSRRKSSPATPVDTQKKHVNLPQQSSEPELSSEPLLTSSHCSNSSPEHDATTSSNSTKWQSVLIEASRVGGVVSDEHMRRLKYCLQWLQYATTRIDQHISSLRACISLQAYQNAELVADEDRHSATTADRDHHTQIQRIKADLLLTIKQVLSILSKYAGGALPEPAKATVRAFFLRLPQRWENASATIQEGIPHNTKPATSASMQDSKSQLRSPSARKSAKKPVAGTSAQTSPAAPAAELSTASHKILTLAIESLDMLQNVTNVFTQSLERAENWVERLRVVSIDSKDKEPFLPPPSLSSCQLSTGEVDTNALPPQPNQNSEESHSGREMTSQTNEVRCQEFDRQIIGISSRLTRRQSRMVNSSSSDSGDDRDGPPRKTPRMGT